MEGLVEEGYPPTRADPARVSFIFFTHLCTSDPCSGVGPEGCPSRGGTREILLLLMI